VGLYIFFTIHINKLNVMNIILFQLNSLLNHYIRFKDCDFLDFIFNFGHYLGLLLNLYD
jgi:hypothetical protein